MMRETTKGRGNMQGKSARLALVALFVVFLLGFSLAADLRLKILNYAPVPAEPGKVVKVWVKIDNNSNSAADDVILEFVPKYPFSIGEGVEAVRVVGAIPPYQTYLARYDVLVASDALDGTYDIEFKVTQDKQKIAMTSVDKIDVTHNAPQVEIIAASPSTAKPGETISVVMTFRNIGGDIAKDVVVSYGGASKTTLAVKPVGSGSIYIEKINAGDEMQTAMALSADPDAELKTYVVPLIISYKNSVGTKFDTNRDLGIKVSGVPEIGVSVSDIVPAAVPGGTSEITFNLFNTGVASAFYAVADVDSSIADDISESRVFIGTLDADDFDSFKTKIRFKAGTIPGKQPVVLTIRYKDAESNDVAVEKVVNVKVLSAQEAAALAAEPPSVWFYVVVLIVLFFAGRWTYRKIKRK